MLTFIPRARALESGAYEIEGRSFRWIDFYDPEARETVIRFGVAEHVPAYSLEFGETVDLVCELVNETRVVRGTDRTATRHKTVVQELLPAGTLALLPERDNAAKRDKADKLAAAA